MSNKFKLDTYWKEDETKNKMETGRTNFVGDGRRKALPYVTERPKAYTMATDILWREAEHRNVLHELHSGLSVGLCAARTAAILL
jgi:hypothetical protein